MPHVAAAVNSTRAANRDFLAHEPHKGLSTPMPAGQAGPLPMRRSNSASHTATDRCLLQESIC